LGLLHLLTFYRLYGLQASAPQALVLLEHGYWERWQGMSDYIVPLLLLVASVLALHRKENTYELLLSGAADGLKLLLSIVPALVLLLSAVTMLRTSGAIEILSTYLAPLFRFFGIPPETAMLMLVRPLSGSAALAVGADLIATHGVDSLIGRTTAIMLGSTETTFYTISVYFGAAGIKKTRYTVPAALLADFTGFFMAFLTARLFYT
jgi:spore maturation protein B